MYSHVVHLFCCTLSTQLPHHLTSESLHKASEQAALFMKIKLVKILKSLPASYMLRHLMKKRTVKSEKDVKNHTYYLACKKESK